MLRTYQATILCAACLWQGGSAAAQLRASFGPHGEVVSLRVGGVEYLRQIAVMAVRPGWSGTLAEQGAVAPSDVRVQRGKDATTCVMALRGEGVSIRLRQTASLSGATLRLDYAATPERAIEVQHILIRAMMPADVHAGRTRYYRAGTGGLSALCPAEPSRDDYILVGAGSSPWLGFAAQGGGALKVTARGASLQFQDDRKWDTPAFELFAAVPGGVLPAGKTVRFGATFTAMTRDQLEAEHRRWTSSDLASIPMSDRRPLRIRSFRPDRRSLRAYETIEFAAEVAATFNNPFDPDDIAVDALVKGPGGKQAVVPGFFMAPVKMEAAAGTERLSAAGKPGFRVRFTPAAPGSYSAVLTVRNGAAKAVSARVRFTVLPSQNPGFVRVSKRAPHYFARDNGHAFVAVGENVCWAGGPTPVQSYTDWLGGLGKAGGNWARLWLAYNEKGLEWTPAPTPKAGTGAYLGLGRYAQDNAWRLDEIVRIAARSGVTLMFCIGTYGEFTEGGYFNEGCWISNPYNARNGGPCDKPEDFWTNEKARKLYKQRLRYLIARYGHAVNLFAWEFWNEVPPTPAQEKWVAEMAAYLKRNDPYRHLVSTTYGSEAVWKCPDVDFSMTHLYGQAGNTADFTPQIAAHARDHRKFAKPYLLAEFGIDWQTADSRWDPKATGVNMHNGAWAAIMAGAAGTAMLWYWDGYVHPGGLYRILTPVRRFANAVDWQAEPMEPLAGVEVRTAPGAPETFKDLTIPGTIEWGLPASEVYTVRHDGAVEGAPVAMAIGSPARSATKELPSKLTWRLELERPTTVTLKLGQVCTRARMVIRVDGEVRLDRALTSGEPGKGPWKASRRLEQYNLWVSDYDEDIPLDLPAGKHEIEVANTEGDWFQIRSITLPGYQSSRYPDVTALGLAGRDSILMWLHNRESTWKTDYDGKTPAALAGLRVTVPVPQGGTWSVEWWDTWRGVITRTETLEVRDGVLTLLPEPLLRDVAVVARRAEAK